MAAETFTDTVANQGLGGLQMRPPIARSGVGNFDRTESEERDLLAVLHSQS